MVKIMNLEEGLGWSLDFTERVVETIIEGFLVLAKRTLIR